MFQKLITYSIRHKLVIGVISIALAIWGVWSLVHLPFDSTPDITDNQVQVITQAPSLGAQEVEQYVTTPVEMALANIPRIQERRSISRSGLSVITLVFDDAADIYWARSQVSQVVEQLEKELPKNTETEMGPIATGLGEIYHYTVRAKKGYEHKYSLTQLRTIQDWIVRKQLSGTPGVAEVSGWGGYVKQYEVAINTDQLNASGVSVSEVFDALQRNNANTGGSYIEQNSNQYYIRGIGVVKNLEDVANITVKTVNGTPVKVSDVAKVQLGHATRFGAVTRNGEGEVVAGIAIMLKGENFQEVIKNVKERISQIQKSLPEGVIIEPFIDRTNLVDRVEGTIARNLIEGGLIVIFVLVIFLGNWRAGLVVASVIPLSMLFAFGMMKTFGIDGNLMSLGAIDFGMIVDSAVIIVEAVVTHINTGHFSQPEVRAAYLAQCQKEGNAVPFALTRKQIEKLLNGQTLEDIKSVIKCLEYMKDATRGFDLYVTDDGVSFDTVTVDGFGDPYNHGLRVFAETDEGLGFGTANPFYGTQWWLIREDNKPVEVLPEAPEATEIPTAYIVSCVTENSGHDAETMNLLPGTFTIGEVTKEGDNYVCPRGRGRCPSQRTRAGRG